MLISVEVARDILLVCKLRILGHASECLLLLQLLSGFYGVQADTIQINREVLQSPLFVTTSLILIQNLVYEFLYRDAFDAPFTVNHVRPGLLDRASRTHRTCPSVALQFGARWAAGQWLHCNLVLSVQPWSHTLVL